MTSIEGGGEGARPTRPRGAARRPRATSLDCIAAQQVNQQLGQMRNNMRIVSDVSLALNQLRHGASQQRLSEGIRPTPGPTNQGFPIVPNLPSATAIPVGSFTPPHMRLPTVQTAPGGRADGEAPHGSAGRTVPRWEGAAGGEWTVHDGQFFANAIRSNAARAPNERTLLSCGTRPNADVGDGTDAGRCPVDPGHNVTGFVSLERSPLASKSGASSATDPEELPDAATEGVATPATLGELEADCVDGLVALRHLRKG